ncbi:hypothetical protein CK203_100009 [Vitis vinifera]|uniref:Uncharacterized protein n=1 Tax=Vitis vinifera TaxID=29760 RepID=A0A438DI82_VITVI|nr:hypothetical protein CK203_100009 [Vitis vinifera]
MVLRSLQPRIARHVVGVPFTDFGEETLWRPERPVDVSAISSSSQRPPRRHKPGTERPSVSYSAIGQPCYATQFAARPTSPYPRPIAPQTSIPFTLRTQRQFSQLGMPLSQTLRKLTEVGLLIALTPRPPSQPIPPQFRMDLHCAYHQGPGHETDRYTALKHAVDPHFSHQEISVGRGLNRYTDVIAAPEMTKSCVFRRKIIINRVHNREFMSEWWLLPYVLKLMYNIISPLAATIPTYLSLSSSPDPKGPTI